jgi:hypothetical protein
MNVLILSGRVRVLNRDRINTCRRLENPKRGVEVTNQQVRSNAGNLRGIVDCHETSHDPAHAAIPQLCKMRRVANEYLDQRFVSRDHVAYTVGTRDREFRHRSTHAGFSLPPRATRMI